MSEPLHHPDPDSLNAFLEGVLPEHERAECLAHLAECASCREIVFLAQEPAPAPAASRPIPAWRRWCAPFPVMAAAAAVCIATVAISLYLRRTPDHGVLAHVEPAAPIPALPTVELPMAQEPKAQAERRPAKQLPPPAAPSPAAAAPTADTKVSVTERAALVDSAQKALPAAGGLSGIAGTVTDPSGATVAAANVTLRQVAGAFMSNVKTDTTGQFKLAGLTPGRYELEVAAPGFRQTSREVELRPQDVAVVSTELAVGLSSETVEVTAAPAVLLEMSSSAERNATLKKTATLPGKLPSTLTATSGKVTLAVDSAGTLFLSRNAGTSWKPVKAAWTGKVVQLVAMPAASKTSPSVFQLTTDSGSIWLSRDGNRWNPASQK